MKRYILRFAALLIMLAILSCSFISCSNSLSGTYVCQDSVIYTTYKFSPFSDKLVMSVLSVSLNGTYEIDGDKIYITIANDRQEHTYSKDGKTIYIDGVAYVKE